MNAERDEARADLRQAYVLSAVLARAFSEQGDKTFQAFTTELKRIAGLEPPAETDEPNRALASIRRRIKARPMTPPAHG